MLSVIYMLVVDECNWVAICGIIFTLFDPSVPNSPEEWREKKSPDPINVK